MTPFFSQVYAVVKAIPVGRVATYGQIAHLLGVPRGARAVGWALRALSERAARRIPWHRVIGGDGRVSLRAGLGPLVQKRRLAAEGIRFSHGRVDLARFGIFK